jgi:hypothetical protein
MRLSWRSGLGWRLAGLVLMLVASGRGAAAVDGFQLTEITALPGSPGFGNFPDINDHGDVTFSANGEIYLYVRSAQQLVNVSALPGAPESASYPKLNNQRNIAMANNATKEIWFYQADGGTFTRLQDVPGFPGNTGANIIGDVMDLNDDDQVSFQSGDNNNGDIYVYDHGASSFEKVTDRAGGSTRGRENRINDARQVVYMGFPDVYRYDIDSQTTVDISQLPGAGGFNASDFDSNANGDIAMCRGNQVIFYDEASAGFEDLSLLPGYPEGQASSLCSLADGGDVVFSRTRLDFFYDIYWFDADAGTFTRMNDAPSGTNSQGVINSRGEIALATGSVLFYDIFLAVPEAAAVPTMSGRLALVASLLLATTGGAFLARRRLGG